MLLKKDKREKIFKQLYQHLHTFQTAVINANTFLTVVQSVIFRWEHWVMITLIYGMGWGETRGSVDILNHASCSAGWVWQSLLTTVILKQPSFLVNVVDNKKWIHSSCLSTRCNALSNIFCCQQIYRCGSHTIMASVPFVWFRKILQNP